MMFQRHLIPKHASNMTRSKCQSLLRRSLVGSLNQTAPMPHRHMKTMMMSTLTDAEQAFVKEGILDERGLVQFDTLHNMQVRSCRVYADKDLFATYSATTQNFEWMTFAECKFICDGGEFVDSSTKSLTCFVRCRPLLPLHSHCKTVQMDRKWINVALC